MIMVIFLSLIIPEYIHKSCIRKMVLLGNTELSRVFQSSHWRYGKNDILAFLLFEMWLPKVK